MRLSILLIILLLQFTCWSQAIDTVDSMLKEMPTSEGKQEAFQKISDEYKAKGNDKMALAFLNKAIKIKDSLSNQAIEKKIAALSSKFEAERSEQAFQLQKEQLSKQRYIIVGLCALFLLTIALVILFYNKYKLRQDLALQTEIAKQQELTTQAVLQAEEKERERIARDLHDGVGQLMSAIKMNLSGLASKIIWQNQQDANLLNKTISLVDESCKEVRNVSHIMMPNALVKAGLILAVKEFTDKIDHTKLQVNFYTEGLQQRLNSNVETVLYRVLQEVVNNVIKHAEAYELYISMIKDKDGISCTIEDNGKGFDVVKSQAQQGIGLKNIQTRIKYLKGTVEWDSFPGKGTLVAIHVPI